MNVSCKVIEDLLPLYHDGVCSEDSRVLVEEHLKRCKKCGEMKHGLDTEPEKEIREDVKAIKGIRKSVRKKVIRGIALGVALCLFAAACGFVLGYVNWKRSGRKSFDLPKERKRTSLSGTSGPAASGMDGMNISSGATATESIALRS